MQNIEFKAELRDMAAARAQARVLGARSGGTVRQTDTYYRLADGRLKRREAVGEPTIWVYYHRPDRVGPRMSNYTILSDAQARRRWGSSSLVEWKSVVKTRERWQLDHVRIHIDDVDDLGQFIELEAMVSREFDVKACHARLAQLRETFAPILGEAVSASYCDLVAEGTRGLGDEGTRGLGPV